MFIQPENQNAPDSWRMVDELIESFISNYPKRWRGFCKFMIKWRATRYNPFGASKGSHGFLGDTQHLAKFPSDPWGNNILLMLEKIMPDIYTNERKMRKLLKRWPMFAGGDKQ